MKTRFVALGEAKRLCSLMKSGHETVESIRKLIAVAADEQAQLVRLGVRPAILRSIELRAGVLREFERLITRKFPENVR